MRRSLKGVLSRVNDLAERVSPSCEGWDWAKIEKESDEELWARMMALVEKAGGPDRAIPAEDCDAATTSIWNEVRERWRRQQKPLS